MMSDLLRTHTQQASVATETGSRRLSFLLGTTVAVVLAITSLAVWSWVRLGSVPAGLDYLAGERLVLDATEQSFGELAADGKRIVAFRLTNLTGRDLTILGARSSCTCIAPENLPMVIPASKAKSFDVLVKSESKVGALSERIIVYTDYQPKSRLVLKVVGRIVGGDTSPGIAARRESRQ